MYRKIKNLVVLSEFYQELALENHAYLKQEVFIDKIYNPIRCDETEIDKECVSDLKKDMAIFC